MRTNHLSFGTLLKARIIDINWLIAAAVNTQKNDIVWHWLMLLIGEHDS